METEICYDLENYSEELIESSVFSEEDEEKHDDHHHHGESAGGCNHDHSSVILAGEFALMQRDEPDHMHCSGCGKRVESGIACQECGKINLWI